MRILKLAFTKRYLTTKYMYPENENFKSLYLNPICREGPRRPTVCDGKHKLAQHFNPFQFILF